MLNVSVSVREPSGRKELYAPPEFEQNCFEVLRGGLVRSYDSDRLCPSKENYFNDTFALAGDHSRRQGL